MSKKAITDATKNNRKSIPLKIAGIFILAVGFAGYFAGFALDADRTREVSRENRQNNPLPIAGDAFIAEYEGALYVYIDNQGGVNVYDLDGKFQFALLMDYRTNGGGGMFFYKNQLVLESRNDHFYIVQNRTLIGDDSIYEKLTDETFIKSKTILAGKYRLGTFGTLQIDGKTVYTTNIVQWYLNSPFVCWAVGILGMALFAADIVLLKLRLNLSTKPRSHREAQ